MSSIIAPFQLLELNIISAQDLAPMSKKMKTYATAWVHHNRKLSTRVDSEGRNNPTWNDKFVFRVDDEFLRSDTSAVMIEIYSLHWLRDTHVGTVRVLVGNLIPPPARPHHQNHHHIGMRFAALQVRRPSGRPQGILNIGVAVLDSSMRSMPLYTHLCASAVGYRDLMGEEDPHHNNHRNTTANNNIVPPVPVRPILRRTRSERSERMTFDDLSTDYGGSMVGVPQKIKGKASSIISGSDYADPPKGKGKGKKKKKASSVISGAELREKPKDKANKGKASSVISASEFKPIPIPIPKKDDQTPIPVPVSDIKVVDPPKETPDSEICVPPLPPKMVTNAKPKKAAKQHPPPPPPPAIGRPVPKYNGYEYGPPKGYYGNGKYMYGGKASSVWSDSEVGPSPSEVAAAMQRYPLMDDNESSLLDGWSLDESVEGLRSKLDRWRSELPPLYDRGFSMSSFRSTSQHGPRRYGEENSGLFSCFGNIFGYECQCVCGKPPGKRGSDF